MRSLERRRAARHFAPLICRNCTQHDLSSNTSRRTRLRIDAISMQHRIQYDLDYLKNWSLWLDLKIITRTALTFLNHGNAY
jgi:lipopolysaccharide/colanic/teichoic acid biosynthesis glycosyltransferase